MRCSAASWPFLLLLLVFLVGNEVFRRYHSRLVFAALLLFFAFYSYAVFVIPVFTRSIGRLTFLASGVCALLGYYLSSRLLRRRSPPVSPIPPEADRRRRSRHHGHEHLLFHRNLPPLPLALSDVGIYHAIRHTGAVYRVEEEPRSWSVRLGLAPPAVHVAPGEKLALYSAVFAPIRMNTRITHRWQWWNAREKKLEHPVDRLFRHFRRTGARLSRLLAERRPPRGDWRVDIDTRTGASSGASPSR